MKNDKQIAFTKLRFQSSSEKFVSAAQCPKPIFRNVQTFCLRKIFYFIQDQICNPNRNYDLNY